MSTSTAPRTRPGTWRDFEQAAGDPYADTVQRIRIACSEDSDWPWAVDGIEVVEEGELGETRLVYKYTELVLTYETLEEALTVGVAEFMALIVCEYKMPVQFQPLPRVAEPYQHRAA